MSTAETSNFPPPPQTPITGLMPANYNLREVWLDNNYAWEIETDTTPSTNANFFGGDQYSFGNGGSMRITAGGSGNQAFARIAGGGLGGTTTAARRQCQLLNPQALPLFLNCRFALASDTGSFNGVIWVMKLEAATGGPSTAPCRFGIAWNGNRQMLEVRGESNLGNTQEYQIPMTFDHGDHEVELYTDGALISVRLDGKQVALTDVSTVGVTGAGAVGTALPIMIEMPVVPSYLDWGINNIADASTNVGCIWHGPITYGWMDKLGGSVR